MFKNIVIFVLGVIIACLIGILIITNYEWFSQEWLIGIGIIIGSVAGIGIYMYSKISN